MWRYRDYRYGQRWQVETTISMIKRRLGGYVLNRSNPARFAEMMLKVLTHNIMLMFLRWWRFSTEQMRPCFYPLFLCCFYPPLF